MQTDASLKHLTILRAADLLPLFGLPYAELLAVETIQLPATTTGLDNVLRVRSPGGQEYILVIEWQGYRDIAMLWRLAHYLSWLGRQNPTLTIVGTVIYLAPEYDVGDAITQTIDGQTIYTWQMQCIRLWEHDARSAVASGNLGLTVLSPLMHHADSNLVEQAVSTLLQQAPLPQQADLLSMLAIFAEPLIDQARITRLVGKERVMQSAFFRSLVEEYYADQQEKLAAEQAEREKRLAEEQAEQQKQFDAKLAQMEAEQSRLQAQVERAEAERLKFRSELQQALEEALIARFPQAPVALIRDIWQVTAPAQLRALITAVIQAPHLADFEQVLKQTAANAGKN